MNLVAAIPLVATVALWGSFIAAMISAGRTPEPVWESLGRSKRKNMVLLLCSGSLGGLYYWKRLWPQLRLGNVSRTPAALPQPDMWSRNG